MDNGEMRCRFDEIIKVLVESKSDDKKSFLNVDEYKNLIAEVKEAKTLLATAGSRKSAKLYRRVRKYDVITINGKELLIKPFSENSESELLLYATNGELFDIIHNTHLAIGHGGRTRMVSEINKHYCNITKETVMLYLRLCTQCQKKGSTPKNRLLYRPVLDYSMISRARVELIDMQSQSYNDHRFIMVYQDHLTKFVLLKPLKTKETDEIALNLLEIYTTFGAPSILSSDNGPEFVKAVLLELDGMWPELKIVNGSLHQQSAELVSRDVEEMLGKWMDENKSKDWPAGIKFIQFQKNCALHSVIGKSPYEAMFGCPARVGLCLAGIPHDDIDDLVTDVENFLKEIERDADNLKDHNANREIEDIDTKNIKLEVKIGTEYDERLTGNDDKMVFEQCSTLSEEVNNDGECLTGKPKHKRSRESSEKQAVKMLKLSDQNFSEIQM